MIETEAAHVLLDRLRQVEDRLGRLLTSGWRQSRGEAAELRHDADALGEAGLPEVAARVAAVARARDAAEALEAIALAVSACRLLRARLPLETAPADWAALRPAKRGQPASMDTALPVARLLLEQREVWVCVRAQGGDWILLEPPKLPDEGAIPEAPSGMFGRLRRQIGQALGGEAGPPSHWLRRRLRGSLRWRARYPVGLAGDVAYCALEGAAWVAESEDGHDPLRSFHQLLATDKLVDGVTLVAAGSRVQTLALETSDPAAYAWVDRSAAAAFAEASGERVWALAWTFGKAVAPLAVLRPGGAGRPPRLVHLVPDLPEDILSAPG